MMKPITFETLRDREGIVRVGWVGHSVIHARFEGSLSAELGVRFAGHLHALVASARGVHCFADTAGLTHYDLLARSAFVRAALANRRSFASFTILTWPSSSSAGAQSLAAALGDDVRVCTERAEFERRLVEVAPLARYRLATSHPGDERSLARER